jgi:YidC/Oxa1 family membrane protein insertase
MFGFLDVPVAGAFHLIDPLVSLFAAFGGGVAVLLAVVLFTCLVRLLLHPLARAAARGERARALLAPRIAELRKKYRDQPARLRAEVVALQQESGVSAFAGCLPLLIQAPFFTIMYRLANSPVVHGRPNVLLTASLLGVHTGQHPLAAGLPGVVLLLLLAGVGTLSFRWQPVTARYLRLLAYLPVLFATFLPLVGGVYLLTSTAWTTVERRVLVPRPAHLVESAGGGD